ncbi:MAG: DUF1365 domain-containing protein [Notoacmeibacter sp.]|nr:DUF1365 domain-containing protein [Notoacmeibacter sp.]
MTFRSALYVGDVVHVRHKPREHKLRYSVFSLLIDLDELPELDRKLPMFGYNRSALLSFHDADHGDLDGKPLRGWAERHMREAGIEPDGGRIAVLCYPRILGRAFNPLTVFYCHDRAGRVKAMLYEVCNTFGERHTYVIPVGAGNSGQHRHSCQKEFYVSPFLPMECAYHFRISDPGDRLLVAINEQDRDGRVLYAAFSATRRELTGRRLIASLAAFPLMGIKVIAAIHWEALRLWLKGHAVFRHRPAKEQVAHSIILPEGKAGT